MDETGNDLGQVLNIEVEGVKMAFKLSKDTLKLAGRLLLFLGNSLLNAKYVKKVGGTNIKNLKARANGQALIPYAMDAETLKAFRKEAPKYGILYHVTEPLHSAKKNGIAHVMFTEGDMASMKELMQKIKDDYIKKNVKNGMSYEDAERDFNTNNSPETMQEYAENVGIMTPPETFDADMREKFGDDYAKKFEKLEIHSEKGEVSNQDFLDALAKEINSTDRMQERAKEKTVDFQFEYDEKNRKSHIVETTDTHVKVLISENGKACVWLPKDAVDPPLNEASGRDEMRTAVLKEGDMLLVQDIDSLEPPYKVPAEELVKSQKEMERKAQEAVEKELQKEKDPKNQEKKEQITISKDLIHEENDHAVKTRVPGTWGADAKYLWINKDNMMDIHNGKTMLTSLDPDKDYKLYSEDNRVIDTIKGKDLYADHYDKVPEGTEKRYGAGNPKDTKPKDAKPKDANPQNKSPKTRTTRKG